MSNQQACSHCGSHSPSLKRDFSVQSWSVLVVWGEVTKPAVGRPLCESCYGELRDILIERASEVDVALARAAKGLDIIEAKPTATSKLKAKKVSKRAS